MFWLFAQMFVLCGFAFVAGAVLTWLPLRATIRGLRAELSHPTTRPALPATATLFLPTPARSPEATAATTDQDADLDPAIPADVVDVADVAEVADVADGAEVAEVAAANPEPQPEPTAEDGFAEGGEVGVKGSSKSMIFHTPDSPYFRRMKGDVTFRSAAEAERAGYKQWRPKTAAVRAG